MHLSQAMKALGDPIRLRLFALLGQHNELCVCHLVDTLALPQSTISRHLGILRQAGLASTRREGKWMYYKATAEAKALFPIIQHYEKEQTQLDNEMLLSIRS